MCASCGEKMHVTDGSPTTYRPSVLYGKYSHTGLEQANKFSHSKLNRSIPQAPHSLTDHKKPHPFKIKNYLTFVNIFYVHNWLK